jgi:diketogulonate reductase-like aldo/keto reductase
VETVSGKPITEIGVGSYGVGGRGHRDVELTEKQNDEIYIDALTYVLQKGINFTEISLGYGHGNALALFKKAFDKSKISRKDFFLTHSFYPRVLMTMEVVKKDLEDFYKIMGTDYADSTLVTQSLVVKFGANIVYPFLHEILKTGKTRFVSLSNASPDFIREFKREFGDNFVAHEGHLSFEVRALQDKGVFETCNELGVTNIIWRPLRRNATASFGWPLLIELATKYQKTQNQIILNWICHLGYHPMVMTASKIHIEENISCNNFQMSEKDYKKLNDFRPPNYNPPPVDWEKNGQGDSIVTLVVDFEKHAGK